MATKKNYVSLKENYPLVPLSRRLPFFYIERSKIVRDKNEIRAYAASADSGLQATTIPVASIGALILGNGVNITSEAARIIVSRGCMILVSGGHGVPIYLASSQHRSPLPKIRQMNITMCRSKRLMAAKSMFLARRQFVERHCPPHVPRFPTVADEKSLERLLSVEAHWAKKAYSKVAKHYDIPWEGKKAVNDAGKHPIIFLNHLSYSLADIAIIHLGYDPNIGITHGRTKGGGLCYDVADIVKPLLALDASFYALKENLSLSEMKGRFMKTVFDLDILDDATKALQKAFKKVDQC